MLQLVRLGEPLEDTSDIPAQLRRIAGDIEEGRLPGVHTACVVLRGEALTIYGPGLGGPLPRLHAAYMALAQAMRELEAADSKIA